MSRERPLFAILLLITLFGLWGIRWGLPSEERNDLFLPASQRTVEFFDQVIRAREDLYAKMQDRPVVYFGGLAAKGELNNLPTLLNSYSSFLSKTHSLDESGTLVMLSKINPLKNRWYPHSFIYGGAYLFPVGAYLGTLHVLHVIRLVSSPLFYYTNPDALARVYIALRVWSVVGVLVGALALFYLGRRLIAEGPALWAALFYGLSPTIIAHEKFAKPHTWAGALSLWAITLALRAKEEEGRRSWLVGSSLCFGLALGMTITQVVFLPFLLWAAWALDWRETARRWAVIGTVAALAYGMTNFYLLAHVKDFLVERAFLSQFAPFKINPSAWVAFFSSVLRISLSHELWALAMAGLVWMLTRRDQPLLRALYILLLGVITYVAFQTQQQSGLPLTSRLFLPVIALLCLAASAVTYAWGRAGPYIRWGCLLVLLVRGALYDAHFAADRVPTDNASRASLWIAQNVQEKSLIVQPLVTPQIDCFPPIDFNRYQIVSPQDEAYLKAKGPVYAVISTFDPRWQPWALSQGFTLIQRFNESPLQKLGSSDPFTTANFVVEIYGRGLKP